MSGYENLLNAEYKNIYDEHWNFMNNTYKSNIEKQYNRSKIGNYIGIQKVKEHVYDLLGAIPVFIFLTEVCSKIKLPSPIYNVEKGVLLLELLLNGYSISEMKTYDPNDSFYKVYKAIFIDNVDFLEEWIDKMMNNCFSNNDSRLLYSKIHNPPNFEHVTLLMDGRTNKIIIEDIDLKKSDLYSYKIKNNGLNTQFVISSEGFVIYVSESLPCKFNNDDNMFISNVNLNRFFKLTDCLVFDGIYENVVNEVITKYNNIGLSISLDNFCFPIRKEKNIPLDLDENNFNKQLGSYRSTIETFFATFSNTFSRFGPRANVRITKERTFNVQIKLACLLYNIKHFVELNKIEEKSYYKLWMDENFDFFNNIDSFNNIINTPKTLYKKENISNMRSKQQEKLDQLLAEGNMKRNSQKNKMVLDEESSDLNEFEVQYIISHKETSDGIEYFVKWRNYNKSFNSYVKESDLVGEDIKNQYWSSLKQ